MNDLSTKVLIEKLSDPDAYPFSVQQITVIQTHISILCFAADWVYKIKKNVSFDFLDFSTLAQRKHYCEEEFRLNSRLSPDMYLAVVPIVLASDGALKIEAQGEAIEYAVKMKCLPSEYLMDHLLETGELDYPQLDRLISRVTVFHQSLASTSDVRQFGSRESIAQSVLGNFSILKNFCQGQGRVLTQLQFEFLENRAESFLRTHEALFDRRMSEGKIKEGHGDLHAGNICLTEDDIMIYDCVEFSKAFRCTDVISDLAFFMMDLDKRGYRKFSRYFASRYRQEQDENEKDFSLLTDFYKTYRALVRAKVEAVQSNSMDQDATARALHLENARAYVRLALSYQLPHCMIILCGLPGSGKSWVAQRVAQPFDSVVLRTDIVRKEMVGRALTHSPGEVFEHGIYSAENTYKTYQKTAELSAQYLSEKFMVVVDASFARKAYRDIFAALASDAGIPMLVLQLNCSDALIRSRMKLRKDNADEVSDADLSVHQNMAAIFERPDEIPDSHRLTWESGGDSEVLLSQLFDKLIECDTALNR